MDVGSLVIADAESTKLIEPRKAPLDDPSLIAPARFRVRCAASPGVGECADYANLAGSTQHHNHGRLTRNQDESADALALPVTAVLHQPIRAPAASHYDLLRELNGQGNSASVANQMALTAGLGPVGGIGTSSLPPKTARSELLSTTARDQSICP